VSRKCPTCAVEYSDDIFFCGEDGTITVQVQSAGDTDPRLGTRLGGYLVVARVADGAMGRVYEGRHPETKARVAVKVLHADVATDSVSVERFRREYETAKELGHPNIVSVLEFGETPDNSWFLTMEYLEGEELGELLRREKIVPFERAVRIFSQFAIGLDHAHSFGVIHRDLKPDNLFLCREESGDGVRILDFGSVKLQMETGPKLTAFGTTLGSPYYMSPEQAMGKQDVDLRTDVYAATAILYEMLTGKIAQSPTGDPTRDSVAQILMAIVNGTPETASLVSDRVPAKLDAVFDRGFIKDKTKRFGSATELAKAFVSGLGLPPELERWANTSPDEIRAALSRTAPTSLAPAAPSASVSVPPAAVAAPLAPAPEPSVSSTLRSAPEPSLPSGEYQVPTRSGGRSTMMVGLAVAAALGVGLVYAFLR
jgi:serine/threonine protein kinase